MIAIIDYDAGNIMSVNKALAYLGEEPVLTRDRRVLEKADKVILPGVGSFGDAMENLRRFELDKVIREIAESGKPFLGICLGLQLLFEGSEESPGVKGLGILEGSIRRFPETPGKGELPDQEAKPAAGQMALQNGILWMREKIPHMGWNSLDLRGGGRLFKDLAEPYVYFVHSYYLEAKDRSIVKASCHYIVDFDASIESGNVFACQFHPEKSGEAGLQILRNFISL